MIRRHNLTGIMLGSSVSRKELKYTSFFKTWFPRLLNLDSKKGRIPLDRSLNQVCQPEPGLPQVVIMKLHYAADKIKILALSGKQNA